MNAGNEPVSAENGDDKSQKVGHARQPAALQTNFERLIEHLPEDSLAGKLVSSPRTGKRGRTWSTGICTRTSTCFRWP